MSLALAEATRRHIRERQMADIESTWPDAVRERLQTNAGDFRIYGIWQRTFRTGLFDPLWPFLDPSRASVDVGALLGQYSLTLAAWSTRCLCIEPLEQYRFMACVVPPNCLWRTVAAGEQRSRGTMHSPVASDGSVEFGLSSLMPERVPHGAALREQTTDVVPLDDIVREAMADEPIGFIKIDVEGSELDVLRGAAETLALHRPALLVETDNVAEVSHFMETVGYRGLFFYRRRLVDLSQFDQAVHRAAEHRWSPERADSFDPDLVMSDLYFVPVRRN